MGHFTFLVSAEACVMTEYMVKFGEYYIDLFLKHVFTLYLWLAENSLYRSSCPQTQETSLPLQASAKIKGMFHHHDW